MLPTKELKRKLTICLRELLDHELIQLALGQTTVGDCIAKKSKGVFTVQVHRGPRFNTVSSAAQGTVEDSPLFDLLIALEFDKASVARIMRQFPPKLIELWADITLAAQEQGKVGTTPQAFFTYYIQRASKGRSTPPDWWRDIERRRCEQEASQQRERATIHTKHDQTIDFEHYLETEVRDAFDQVMKQLRSDLIKVGKSEGEADTFAREHATLHFRNKFSHARRGDSTTNMTSVAV